MTMREKMARAMLEVQEVRSVAPLVSYEDALRLAYVALDCLTARPSDYVARAPYREGLLRYGESDADSNGDPAFALSIYEAMIRAMIEGK